MIWFFSMLRAALYTIFIQNLVFNGGYGSSEAIRMSAKPQRFLPFSMMIAFFSTVTALVCRTLDNFKEIKQSGSAVHAALYCAVLISIYLFVALILKLVLDPDKKFFSTLGIAALNTLVFAVPLINRNAGYSYTESIGVGVGSGIAFILALLLINVGLKRLEANNDIPPLFRGTPAMFLYVAMLSLAFNGFSGSSLFT
ncbi:MAG: hypothetical protein K6F09_00940 [Clostridiales bacterium]|nr:hypothetical protein [Clostridiales bacterium]